MHFSAAVVEARRVVADQDDAAVMVLHLLAA
jgi:hypothetical protein